MTRPNFDFAQLNDSVYQMAEKRVGKNESYETGGSLRIQEKKENGKEQTRLASWHVLSTCRLRCNDPSTPKFDLPIKTW